MRPPPWVVAVGPLYPWLFSTISELPVAISEFSVALAPAPKTGTSQTMRSWPSSSAWRASYSGAASPTVTSAVAASMVWVTPS